MQYKEYIWKFLKMNCYVFLVTMVQVNLLFSICLQESLAQVKDTQKLPILILEQIKLILDKLWV